MYVVYVIVGSFDIQEFKLVIFLPRIEFSNNFILRMSKEFIENLKSILKFWFVISFFSKFLTNSHLCDYEKIEITKIDWISISTRETEIKIS